MSEFEQEWDELVEGSTYDYISVQIASDEMIRQWSYGEIKKPETINYRTFKPEKGGLFCEKIFGPTRDWECACGKYKKIKHKGIVCDRCGVEVTSSSVRRERMAHIDLAVPVVHIWFFKNTPSRIANLLGLSSSDLERIIYYEEYVVTDPGKTELVKKQLLNDAQLREAQEKYGLDAFKTSMGGEAIRTLLETEDLQATAQELKDRLRKTKSMTGRVKLSRRLKIVESFISSTNKPEWMVLKAVPVIPPDLRPLVPLDGGRFATSDLNDLYRRVINRNNRLKVILKLKTPEVIIRNEKRMLQEAVDALFDNSRSSNPVHGAGNRPLKSLSELLKGKQGRFRQNLLGKRVDYSGRSVIVVGPELNFNQCGLPKEMALELFEPFIVRALKECNAVVTIRSAKKLIQRREPVVWDVLEKIVKGHPVLLNRAPTLHRLGIQAFEPVLVEGKAIQLHPLVCKAFNADFDGDQMAVHVPLSLEAQAEARLLMMSSDNIYSPASGEVLAVPSQDMLLGLYYLMHEPLFSREQFNMKTKVFKDTNEVLLHLGGSFVSNWSFEKDPIQGRRDDLGRGLHIHEKIKIRIGDSIIETTPGRVLFNEIVPKELGFQNYTLTKKTVGSLVTEVHRLLGIEATVKFLDRLKNLGFTQATKASLSMGIWDVKIPDEKAGLLAEAEAKVDKVNKQCYEDGIITNRERSAKTISIWTETTDKISEHLFKLVSQTSKKFELNPIHAMMTSGARGNPSQVRQLCGMRGLMSKPSGEIIETPITANFREGLTVLDYFTSSHGARKGLADTALKTADSGYLTRRLVDVAQDVLVNIEDCKTLNFIEVAAIKQGGETLLPLKNRIYGRTVIEDVTLPGNKEVVIAKAGDMLTSVQAKAIEDAGYESVRIRSALTCEAPRGICAKCYGINLATGHKAAEGEAVGIIAAQSIGEPGTQLTMRTFHTGGVASTGTSSEILAEKEGLVVFLDVRMVRNRDGNQIVLNKNGRLLIVKDEGRSIEEYRKLLRTKTIEPLESFNLEIGTVVLVEENAKVKLGSQLALCEQHNIPIICEKPGYAKFEDLVEGISTHRTINKLTGQAELVVRQHRSELYPTIKVFADKEFQTLLGSYLIPSNAYISVAEGQYVEAGDYIARLPRSAMKTSDITGGLPRVAELVEARSPAQSADIVKIDGEVHLQGIQKNKRVVVVRDPQTGMEEQHLISLNKHLIVHNGDIVEKGQLLTEGTAKPSEILEICGVRELQRYLVNQVQEVYRLQGVEINDKHIEIIVRQMLQRVRIVDPGDTTFLYGEDVSKKEFFVENRKVIEDGGRPAQAAPAIFGITRTSLSNESFLASASFQETTRVLTDAACASARDYFLDFKSNVISGSFAISGTGYAQYRKRLKKNVEVEEEENLDFLFDEHTKLETAAVSA